MFEIVSDVTEIQVIATGRLTAWASGD